VTGFGKGTSAVPKQLLIDLRGRAVIAGTMEGPALDGGVGLALARYGLGR
jgi:hypothetical protein